jgi:DNA topoisomerase-1
VLSAISTSEVDRFATLQRSSGSRRLPSLRLGRRSGSQEQAKYDKRIRFAEKLPELREAMAEHLDKGELDRGRLQPDEQAAQRLREALPGPEFSAKDFRTWGGTLLAAIALAEYAKRKGFPETKTDEKRSISAAMRRVAQQLGNTPAVCRASYVSPAVIEQYLDGRTIEDYRPRHLRAVGARETGLDQEEQALLSLLRSWRIRQAQVPRDFSAHFR